MTLDRRPSDTALLRRAAAPPAALPVRALATELGRALERMNGTERKYAELLELRRRCGEVAWFEFESITLRLGDDLRYTPDFAVVLMDGAFELHETKGHWRDDARVKIRAAAERFPFTFRAFRLQRRVWVEEVF